MLELFLSIYLAGSIVYISIHRKVPEMLRQHTTAIERLTEEQATFYKVWVTFLLFLVSLAWPLVILRTGLNGFFVATTMEEIQDTIHKMD